MTDYVMDEAQWARMWEGLAKGFPKEDIVRMRATVEAKPRVRTLAGYDRRVAMPAIEEELRLPPGTMTTAIAMSYGPSAWLPAVGKLLHRIALGFLSVLLLLAVNVGFGMVRPLEGWCFRQIPSTLPHTGYEDVWGLVKPDGTFVPLMRINGGSPIDTPLSQYDREHYEQPSEPVHC